MLAGGESNSKTKTKNRLIAKMAVRWLRDSAKLEPLPVLIHIRFSLFGSFCLPLIASVSYRITPVSVSANTTKRCIVSVTYVCLLQSHPSCILFLLSSVLSVFLIPHTYLLRCVLSSFLSSLSLLFDFSLFCSIFSLLLDFSAHQLSCYIPGWTCPCWNGTQSRLWVHVPHIAGRLCSRPGATNHYAAFERAWVLERQTQVCVLCVIWRVLSSVFPTLSHSMIHCLLQE